MSDTLVIRRQRLIEGFRTLPESDQEKVIDFTWGLVRTNLMTERRRKLGAEQCPECHCLKAGHHAGGCEGAGGNCGCNLRYY